MEEEGGEAERPAEESGDRKDDENGDDRRPTRSSSSPSGSCFSGSGNPLLPSPAVSPRTCSEQEGEEGRRDEESRTPSLSPTAAAAATAADGAAAGAAAVVTGAGTGAEHESQVVGGGDGGGGHGRCLCGEECHGCDVVDDDEEEDDDSMHGTFTGVVRGAVGKGGTHFVGMKVLTRLGKSATAQHQPQGPVRRVKQPKHHPKEQEERQQQQPVREQEKPVVGEDRSNGGGDGCEGAPSTKARGSKKRSLSALNSSSQDCVQEAAVGKRRLAEEGASSSEEKQVGRKFVVSLCERHTRCLGLQ